MNFTSLYFALILLPGVLFAQEWELKKESDHIRVYTRQVDSTAFNEYRAELIARTTPEKALRLICDGDRLWEWNHKTSASETLHRYNDSTLVIWMHNDLPWPFRDRENLSLIQVRTPKTDEYLVTIEPADNAFRKPDEEVIRTTRFKGHWNIEKLKDGKVKIVQQLYGDPNGMIPGWLLNSILTTVPFHSFENLKVILEN
ncbi:START domain-containing protein [Robertkochia flava]|uniref:START domain-containing protein n=1 Tax=Robertkochia flava TaxID=3447986 RepID=UPI001CCC3220|nr:START domain-containing protein [Robertkochia marina]